MAQWQKLLARMRQDGRPVGYSYNDAALVLRGLGFALAPHGPGSHRKWRRALVDGRTVVIGLVDRGSGPLKPYLVRDMIAQLQLAGLLTIHVDHSDAPDR